MPTANVVDVSEWQPTSIDWANLKANGVQAVIVRIGHGTTQDTNAAEHISNASQAGLIVHVYHYYEGVDGELEYSVSNAKSLSILPNVYYFLDMEGTIAGSWPSIFESFRQQWSDYGWNTGLYCSLSNYAKFDDTTLVNQGVYRWIAAWGSNQPSSADMWQYDSKTGLGSYTSALDKDVDIVGKLIKQPDNTVVKSTDPNGTYTVKPGAFVGFDYSTTEVVGGKMLVASPDGVNKIPKLGPDGSFLFNEKDAQSMGGMLIEGNSALVTSDDLNEVKLAASEAAFAARQDASNAMARAQNAIDNAKVTSDAAVAASQTAIEAKTAADSAAAEIQQTKVNAASEAAAIQQNVADMQTAINTANSANEEAVKSAQADIASVQSNVGQVKTNLATVSGNLDVYAQSAAEQGQDITVIKQNQGQFEADFASVNGKINQLQVDTDGLRENVKDNQDNISSLQTSASQVSADLKNAESQVAELQLTASDYKQTFADQDGRISKVEQTATEHDSEIADNKGNISNISQKVDDLTTTFADAQKDINDIKVDASGLHDTLTDQGSQIASLNTTVDSLDSKYSGITGDLQSKQTALSTEQQQTSSTLLQKADKTYVDSVNNTAQQLSSKLDVMAGQIQSKVDETKVNNLIDGRGYATQSTVQSLIDQKAGTLSESITQLDTKYSTINGINLLKGTTDFSGDWFRRDDGSWLDDWWIDALGHKAYGRKESAWNGLGQSVQVDAGEYTFSCQMYLELSSGQSLSFYGFDSQYNGTAKGSLYAGATYDTSSPQNQWFTAVVHMTITTGGNLSLRPELNQNGGTVHVGSYKLERGYVENPVWTPAPSDNATVTQLQSVTASIDGLQSNVTDFQNNTNSQFTQLSNVVQSKVGTDDFNVLKQTVNLQTLDSADINTMKTNGHYLVLNPINIPADVLTDGGNYVDIIGDGSFAIRQDVYQYNGNKHKYRNWSGNKWSDWNEGATYSEITQLQDDINLRVTKGDLISQINLEAGTTLVQSNKIVLDADTTFFTGDAFIPNAAISSITADKITLGSTSLWDSNGAMNLVNTQGGVSSRIMATQGNVNIDGIVKFAPIIQFSSNVNENTFTVTPAGATVTPTLFFEKEGHSQYHWMGFTRNFDDEKVEFHTWDDEGERFGVDCRAKFVMDVRVLGNFSQGKWDGTPGKPNSGIMTIKNGNTIWSGSSFLAIGDNNTNSYADVMARSFSQQSTLSAKTNIQPVDPKDALDLINRTDIYSYQYKSDVANGSTKRYTSLIIDDVNDVSKYYAPDEFVNEKRTGRDDGSTVGYLVLAVKELTSRIKALESQAK